MDGKNVFSVGSKNGPKPRPLPSLLSHNNKSRRHLCCLPCLLASKRGSKRRRGSWRESSFSFIIVFVSSPFVLHPPLPGPKTLLTLLPSFLLLRNKAGCYIYDGATKRGEGGKPFTIGPVQPAAGGERQKAVSPLLCPPDPLTPFWPLHYMFIPEMSSE